MDVLEKLLNQAINPSNQQYTSDTVKTIVKLIDSDPNAIPVTLRLIAHRFQSPQEREALNALYLLELLVNQCGPGFLSEVGKFKFLNEMIKVLSPKFLGDQSTEAVKKKCVKLLHQWQRDYSSKEPKFAHAYNMLCNQGIIDSNDMLAESNGNATPTRNSNQRENIFDRSAQSRKLTTLLRSKNPADISEANRIIKSILEEDQKRMDKVMQRSAEMESLKNNAALLEELTRTLSQGEASTAEVELMTELGSNIRKSRSRLYEFSLTHEENDVETLAEIAHICDQASTALQNFEQQLKNPNLIVKSRSETQTHTPAATTVDDLLSQDLKQLGLDTIPTENSFEQCLLLGDELPGKGQSSSYSELVDIFSSITSSCAPPSSSNPSKTTQPTVFATPSVFTRRPEPRKQSNGSISQMFNDLDAMGRRMFGLDNSIPPEQPPQSEAIDTNTDAVNLNSVLDPPASAVDLTDIDVPLSSVRPHQTFLEPLIIFPGQLSESASTLRLALHYTANRPAENVIVFVAVATNHGPSNVTDLHLRFGVKRPLQLRQLPPSGQSLCAYSPLVPISSVNQVLLVHNPSQKRELTIKFQLSFNQDDDAILESGQVNVPLHEP